MHTHSTRRMPRIPSTLQLHAETSEDSEEIVADSEPEREEYRRTLQQEKRRIKRLAKTQNKVVVELTDSESIPSRHIPTKVRSPDRSVIEITDESSAECPVDKASNGAVTLEDVPLALSLLSSGSLASLATPATVSEEINKDPGVFPPTRQLLNIYKNGGPSILNTEFVHASNDDVEAVGIFDSSRQDQKSDEGTLMNLGRFAYDQPVRIISMASSRAGTISRAGSVVKVVPSNSRSKKGKGVARLPPLSLSADFPNAEMERILKCVSCDLVWTTRKTAAAKTKHIQTCAKKHSLSHEIVCNLIRKELENAPPVEKTRKSKTKALEVAPAPQVPKTLLEDAVADGAKKRGKRPQVLETVQTPNAVRDLILDRARRLLGASSDVPVVNIDLMHPIDRIFMATQGTAPVNHPPAQPPLTQVFTKSALARQYDIGVSDLIRPFALTQKFVPSKLGATAAGLAPSSTESYARTKDDLHFPNDNLHQNAPAEVLSALAPDKLALGSAPTINIQEPPATQIFSRSKFASKNQLFGADTATNVCTASIKSASPMELANIHTESAFPKESGYNSSPQSIRSSSRPIYVVSSSSEADCARSPQTTGLTGPTNACRPKCVPTGVPMGPLLRSTEKIDISRHMDDEFHRDSDNDDAAYLRFFSDESPQTNHELWLHNNQDIPTPSSSKLPSTLPDPKLSLTLPPHYPEFHPSQRFLPQEGSPPYCIAPWSPPSYDDPMLLSHISPGPAHVDVNDMFQPEPAVLSPSPKRRTRLQSVDAAPSSSKKSKPPKMSDDELDARLNPSPKRRTRLQSVDAAPSSSKKSKPPKMSDDELDARLKECILNDPDLHLRVLRYEPLHFDIFLQLALDMGLSSRGLKLRVRNFLDKQAIHFHLVEPGKRRTKKRRTRVT